MGKMPWRRAWTPTPVFLPGESHGQRSLAGYSPRGCTELDVTEQTHAGTALVLRTHRENQEGEKNLDQSLEGQCRHPGD